MEVYKKKKSNLLKGLFIISFQSSEKVEVRGKVIF